jgi:hypothetical protein
MRERQKKKLLLAAGEVCGARAERGAIQRLGK